MKKIEIQFDGYESVICDIDNPKDCDVFEDIDNLDRSVEIITDALAGDADENGWISSEASETGETFQVREIFPELRIIESEFHGLKAEVRVPVSVAHGFAVAWLRDNDPESLRKVCPVDGCCCEIGELD